MKKILVVTSCIIVCVFAILIYKNRSSEDGMVVYQAYQIKPGSTLPIYFNNSLKPTCWKLLATDGELLEKDSRHITVRFPKALLEDVPLIYKDGKRQIVLIFRLTGSDDLDPVYPEMIMVGNQVREGVILPASISNFPKDMIVFTQG